MFAAFDRLDNRTLVVLASDAHRESFIVRIQSERVGPLSAAFVRRTIALPTERRLRRIASVVLNGRLVRPPASRSLLPTAVIRSPHRALLERAAAGRNVLDFIGPTRTAASVGNIRTVRVRVVTLAFDRSSNRLRVRQRGPTGVVSRGTPAALMP